MLKMLVVCPLVLALGIGDIASAQVAPVPVPQSSQPATPIPDSAKPTGVPPAPNTLLDGTAVKLRLAETISSASAKAGQQVPFEVTEDVLVQGVIVLPKGSQAVATVTEASLTAGKHDIVVKKTGYTDWTRSMTVASGSVRLNADMVAK